MSIYELVVFAEQVFGFSAFEGFDEAKFSVDIMLTCKHCGSHRLTPMSPGVAPAQPECKGCGRRGILSLIDYVAAFEANLVAHPEGVAIWTIECDILMPTSASSHCSFYAHSDSGGVFELNGPDETTDDGSQLMGLRYQLRLL